MAENRDRCYLSLCGSWGLRSFHKGIPPSPPFHSLATSPHREYARKNEEVLNDNWYHAQVFLWCLVINIGLLIWWFLIILFARDWVYRVHGKWFKLSREQFDAIHYEGIVFYKICIFIFNVVPYIALCIVRWEIGTRPKVKEQFKCPNSAHGESGETCDGRVEACPTIKKLALMCMNCKRCIVKRQVPMMTRRILGNWSGKRGAFDLDIL